MEGGNTPAPAGAEPRQGEKDYETWDRESLVKRVKQLEEELKRRETSSPSKEREETKTPATATTTASTTAATTSGNANDKGKKSKKDRKAAGEGKKVFDPSRYETRMIALKLAYLGKNYGGFEYTPMANVPTIEEELWKALVKSCLIFPENPDVIDFSPFEYAKCGRTDRGVSAFGQVINLRVRSQKKVDRRKKVKQSQEEDGSNIVATEQQQKGDVEMKDAPPAEPVTDKKESTWDPVAGEIPYCKVLNRLLPPDIRILAWAPSPPPNFSSRFSCRERQYRYFFTQPAFSPPPTSLASPNLNNGWLDIEAMRQAAKLFEGLHDFRNFCKVDPSKQITNYERRIFESDIVEVKDTGAALPYLTSATYSPHPALTDGALPKVYYFHVRGSAFLWHQIRHMVGILFLVGQGLESPSIVSELLDIDSNPRRPAYLMADEVPLVLWDCIFPKLDPSESGAAPRDREEDLHDPDNAQINLNMKDDGIDWIWCGEHAPSDLHGSTGLLNQSWEYWRARKMDELLSAQLLNKIAGQADITKNLPEKSGFKVEKRTAEPQKIFKGGNRGELLGPYKPVMQKDKLESPAEQHDKWARSKGFSSAEEMKKIPEWHRLVRANKRKAADAGIETPSSNGGDAASVAE